MSRCFPFPPPGYENKATLDYLNLLEKEKQEKKHKKEKKDKKDKEKRGKREKKDRKEKKKDKKGEKRKHKREKEKERCEDVHREKKVPTEEHNDDSKAIQIKQIRTSVENSTFGPVNCSNGKNPGSNCTQRDEISEFKDLVESEKSFRDDDKAKENLSVQKINLTNKRNVLIPIVVKDGRDHDREVFRRSNEVVARAGKKCSRFNYNGGDERKVERVSDVVDKYVENRTEQKENGVHNDAGSKRDEHKDTNSEMKSKSKDKKREDKKANVMEQYEEQLNARITNMNAVCFHNDKSSSLLEEDYNTSNLGKRKELEINGFLLNEHEIRPNKLRRTLPPVVENGKNSETCATSIQHMSKLAEKEKHNHVNSNFSSCDPDMENGFKVGPAQASNKFVSQWQDMNKASNNIQSSHPVMQNDGKSLDLSFAAKELASEWQGTGNVHDIDSKVSLRHSVVRNGKSDYQVTTRLASGGYGMTDNQKVDHDELKINGLTEDKRPNDGLKRPSSKKVKKDGGVSTKPPHPDSMYLSQILNIPTPELSDLDDQDWLLGSYNRQSNKSASGSSQVEETEHLWAKALRIKSADVIALPYVIPY